MMYVSMYGHTGLKWAWPLFLSPFSIRVKCLFQEMWERGIAWDEDLPSDLEQNWHQWCSEIPYLKRINIPRHYDDEEMK